MSDEVNDAVKTKLDVIPGIAMEYFSLTSNIVVLSSVDCHSKGHIQSNQLWR